MQSKDVWSSKWVFILAAIGAAAGLGNLWRFPYMVYENGGGAFLLAYLIVLFTIGIPLVIMEVGLGQRGQTDFVQTFKNFGGRFGAFISWMVTLIVLLLAGYYAAIIAWGFDFLAVSPSLGWGADAQSYFHKNILQLTESPDIWGGFSKAVIYGLIATYLAVFFSIFKGLKSVGAVVKWTVPLPFLFLVILFVNACFLPGSKEGFAYFLIPDWSQLASVELWKNAVSQALFSMNVGLALTVMYASYSGKREKIVQSGLLIALGDSLVSLMAGFAMFGTLGWMAINQGIDIQNVVESGPTLAFVTFPTALAALPFGAGFFATLFFLAILTLAIDSMFALVELITSILKGQFQKFKSWSQSKLTLYTCITLFVWSLAFAGGNGLYRLDVVDHFLFSHLFYWAIIGQILLIGWALPADKLRQHINNVSDFQLGNWFNWILKYITPLLFIGLYALSLPEELAGNYEGYSNNFILWWGLFPCAIIIGLSLLLSSHDK